MELFGKADASDAELAAAIARRLDCELPGECEAGLAMNARILQRHADILLESGE